MNNIDKCREIDLVRGLASGRPAGQRIGIVTIFIALAALLVTDGNMNQAAAQAAAAVTETTAGSTELATPAEKPNVVDGFIVTQTADLGGHLVGVGGSGAMYDTLVNIHSGPRVLNQTFDLKAAPGSKHHLVDTLSAMSNGFGGDPINYTKLDFSKGKAYEFNGVFRRDRQYFDYDLLGNPLIPAGQSIPIGTGGTLGSLAWPQVTFAPELYNTVRRMTDVGVTILPLSKVTFHTAYSQNVFQGPSYWPGYAIGKTDMLLLQSVRNSSDNFRNGVDWKPWSRTKLTLESEITHYKINTSYSLAPFSYNVQEANGLPVSLGAWDSTTPYSTSDCNTTSMANSSVILTAAAGATPGSPPTIDPACDVTSKYTRFQDTRDFFPTEVFRFQSSRIKHIDMNGVFRYTEARSNLPYFDEYWAGLDANTREETITGWSRAKRQEVGVDYEFIWQATNVLSVSDQYDYSNAHEPGELETLTDKWITGTTAGLETINNPAVTASLGTPATAPTTNYFGQKIITNNLTGTWDITPRVTASLTWRYKTNNIVLVAVTDAPTNINENGGVLNLALRPTNRWTINGTAEAAYDDNAFTALSPRQMQHYRMHTTYRPKEWATISASYDDRERHNNTDNITTSSRGADGPLQHVDYFRIGGVTVVLAPTEVFSLDMDYSHSEVYTATNSNFDGGGITTPACPVAVSGVWCTRNFMDAPTNTGSFGLVLTPKTSIKYGVGYRISDVNGTQVIYNTALVNGALQSAYQTPYANVAWTLHKGLVWKADYKYYSYGEAGPAGPTAPRNTHANMLTLLIHYEF